MNAVMERAVEMEAIDRREALRAGLERNRAAFRALVSSLTPERLSERSPTTKWTIGEVLFHLTWALEALPAEIENSRKQKGMFNYPGFVADPLSYWYTRWKASGVTVDELLRRYDAGITAAIASLEHVPDTDWELGARFYGERFYSVSELFMTPSEHFTAHTTGIASS